ncbi:hypothetical protein MJO28_000775 [Puccinia striiformis f. sp. tritici]|uniref:Secreted protein n=2 Tax=Puccinia striiformis f. sp. tritici TaxID=168172 RepID=A0A0L0VPT9_9BASI|nr:hypothetical protein MJO28_000775 [Puccinia striiformis f. sp. tritici]KAI7967192.1 hypothetical protein MJO29_000469 [Puccinia striiformis f. sp. tritici]KAI9603617.1 hypothetical protein KEM48_000377 [Puccinia striiformis f. sp. tritici PST-130]KNF01000.1 hypothetical protein PSTG_05633 [Puccinia striiformis f. sp. tritici PST-78]
MFAVKDATRGMIRMLSIGMIITLSVTLANAHVCYDAYETPEGGYSPPPGKASCGEGGRTYQCDLTACTPVHQIFQRCAKKAAQVPGNMNVRVLSYVAQNNLLTVFTDTGTPGKTSVVYCPNDVENKVKITFCPDASCG